MSNPVAERKGAVQLVLEIRGLAGRDWLPVARSTQNRDTRLQQCKGTRTNDWALLCFWPATQETLTILVTGKGLVAGSSDQASQDDSDCP